ncbi:MAG: rhamnogalacturonan acetylesterase [Clostridia bacterium]|nr:rhamnogalacturonan acetylesterase [Clostridia bacterium]
MFFLKEVNALPRIFLVGDSTVDDNTPPFRGWGWALPEYVREGVTVKNHALSGESSRSFWGKGLFDPVREAMTGGDMLLVQFGHNDEKDDERHTDPASSFPRHLRIYIDAARAKGALPVLITPVARRFFTADGGILYTHGEYPAAIRALAQAEGVPLCDLKADSRALYLKGGPDKTAELFVRLKPGEHPDFPDGHDDKTHFCAEGAKVIAGLVARELWAHPACRGFINPPEGEKDA